jgi:hypothetical protein
MSVAQVKTLEPSNCFCQILDTGFRATRFEIRKTEGCLSHRGIVKNGRKRESFVATLQTMLEIALLDVCCSQS